ncbi:MAG: sulfite exporter TauE/SafE family protein, partial [Propionicimonas sp.]
LVAVSASVGFLLRAGESGVPWLAVLGLVSGGAVVAPFAARLAHRAPHAVLGVCVGGMVLVSNLAVIAKGLELPVGLTGLLAVVIALATAAIAARVWRGQAVACEA